MINIYEYLLSKKNKFLNKFTNDNIHDVIKDTLKELGPNADLNFLDTSEITKMDNLFNVKETKCVDFNGDVSGWDVSHVYTFESMFSNCKNFNCDLSKWQFGKQNISMDGMFFKCESFNKDISSWNVDNVSDMAHMFNGCKRFNKNISNWNIKNVGSVYMMFAECEDFSQDLSGWTFNKICVNKAGFKDMFYNFNKFPIKFMPHQLQKLLKQ